MMIHRFWHFVVAALLAAFLLAFYANNRPAAAGSAACRGVAELMAYIEARETGEVQFDFMDSAERAAFAARTKMNDANSVEVLTARKADPTASVLVAIVRDGCVTSVRFFKPQFFEPPGAST